MLVLTSTYGKILDFIVQVISVHVEDDPHVEDEEGDEKIGDVISWGKSTG